MARTIVLLLLVVQVVESFHISGLVRAPQSRLGTGPVEGLAPGQWKASDCRPGACCHAQWKAWHRPSGRLGTGPSLPLGMAACPRSAIKSRRLGLQLRMADDSSEEDPVPLPSSFLNPTAYTTLYKGLTQEELLWSASADGNIPMISRLVEEEGVNINVAQPDLEDGEMLDPSGGTYSRRPSYTPMHMAALMGQVESIKLLAELGADVNARTDGMATPLHVAAINGRAGAVQALADAGCDLRAENEFGHTALKMAKLYWRHKKTIALLKDLTGEKSEGPEWTDTAITGC